MIFVQVTASPLQDVLVQTAGCLDLTQRAQVRGQLSGDEQGVGVILAQDPTRAVQSVLR